MDVAQAPGIDYISAEFLKNGAPVIAIALAKIINMSIKLDTFDLKCKITPLLQKGIKTEVKYIDLFLSCLKPC